MYSVVLPIKATENDMETQNYILFRDLGVPSFEKFWDINNLKTFYVVCPERDTPLLENLLKNKKLPYRIVSEDSLGLISCRGWDKQQLIKLKMSEIVDTPYYLVLDSDHFLTRNFSYKDMFENRKIKYTYEPWQTENSDKYSTNSRWWESSCRLLKFPVSSLQDKKDLMGVTPQVLITNIVISLLKDIGEKWQEDFVRERATEFTLYWIYILSRGYTHNYTTLGKPLWKHDLSSNILVQNQDVSSIRIAFKDESSFFSVIQGYLHLDNERYIKEARPYVISANKKTLFLVASVLSPIRQLAFDSYERFQQIVETGQSIRKYVPDSVSIIIEGSQISDMVRVEYKKNFDHVIELGNDTTVVSYTNHPQNIGHGEMKLLERGIDYISEHIDRNLISLVIKLGARYRLNNNFSLAKFNIEKYTFRSHIDDVLKLEVFTTGLYGIPISRIDEFKKLLVDAQNILSAKTTMIEHLFSMIIQEENIHKIDTLGLEGQLSYNKHFFSV